MLASSVRRSRTLQLQASNSWGARSSFSRAPPRKTSLQKQSLSHRCFNDFKTPRPTKHETRILNPSRTDRRHLNKQARKVHVPPVCSYCSSGESGRPAHGDPCIVSPLWNVHNSAHRCGFTLLVSAYRAVCWFNTITGGVGTETGCTQVEWKEKTAGVEAGGAGDLHWPRISSPEPGARGRGLSWSWIRHNRLILSARRGGGVHTEKRRLSEFKGAVRHFVPSRTETGHTSTADAEHRPRASNSALCSSSSGQQGRQRRVSPHTLPC